MKKLNIEGLKTLTRSYVSDSTKATGDNSNGLRETVLSLPLASIEPDPEQPRKSFDDQELDELAESIRRYGLLQPIVVREKEGEPDRYVIVAGERRWRACRRLKEPNVRALLLRSLPTDGLGYLQMIENLQRSNLTVEEVAVFISRMIAGGASQQEVADRLGLRRDRVSLYALWERFPDCVQEAVREGRIAAIRTACELRTLYEKHPDEVEAFLSENEAVSMADVRRFADSFDDNDDAREPESPELPLDASDADDEAPDDSTAAEHTESASEPSVAADLLENDESVDDEISNEEGGTEDEGSEDENKAEEDGAVFVEDDLRHDEDAVSPTVLCQVEGRSCRLLWRTAADRHVWVRWEDDGDEEELPIETVRLLSVQCGEGL